MSEQIFDVAEKYFTQRDTFQWKILESKIDQDDVGRYLTLWPYSHGNEQVWNEMEVIEKDKTLKVIMKDGNMYIVECTQSSFDSFIECYYK